MPECGPTSICGPTPRSRRRPPLWRLPRDSTTGACRSAVRRISTSRSARALDLLLDEWGRYPIALACSSGNRAGALLALRAFWLDGADAASALELGLAAGLTRLEPSVRLLLGLPPMSPTPADTSDTADAGGGRLREAAAEAELKGPP